MLGLIGSALFAFSTSAFAQGTAANAEERSYWVLKPHR